MLLLDVGNSTVEFVQIKNQQIVIQQSFNLIKPFQQTIKQLFDFLTSQIVDIKGKILWVASVVPEFNPLLDSLAQDLQLTIKFAHTEKEKIIPTSIESIQSVGVDRLLAALAVAKIYSEHSNTGKIILQCGTALTINYLDPENTFQGGYILPGPTLWLSSFTQTAQLPKLNTEQIDWLSTSLGKNTKEALLNPIPSAYTSLLENFIQSINQQTKLKNQVILTGGWAEKVLPLLRNNSYKFYNKLVLTGLAFFAEQKNT